MSKPVIRFSLQNGQSASRFMTNQPNFTLRFDEVPAQQITGMKVTGDAQLTGEVDSQGWVNAPLKRIRQAPI